MCLQFPVKPTGSLGECRIQFLQEIRCGDYTIIRSDAVNLIKEEGAIGRVYHIIEIFENEDAGREEPRLRKDLLHGVFVSEEVCDVSSKFGLHIQGASSSRAHF